MMCIQGGFVFRNDGVGLTTVHVTEYRIDRNATMTGTHTDGEWEVRVGCGSCNLLTEHGGWGYK